MILLKYISFLWVLLVFSLSIFQYVFGEMELNHYNEQTSVIQIQNQRLQQMSKIVSKTMDLLVLSKSMYNEDLINFDTIRSSIQTSVNQIIDYNERLLKPEYAKYFELTRQELEVKIFQQDQNLNQIR